MKIESFLVEISGVEKSPTSPKTQKLGFSMMTHDNVYPASMQAPSVLALTVLGLVRGASASTCTACPVGWTNGHGPKCMRITPPTTHAGCADACGVDASLACIQSIEDDALAAMVSPKDLSFVWVGEYQWPFEPTAEFGVIRDCQVTEGITCTKPYKGQPNWGKCSNGQTTNLTNSLLSWFQPNNFNGGEDCMARSMLGYADNTCNELRPCLCEWQANGASRTSAEYLRVHGPALSKKASDGLEAMTGLMRRYLLFGLLIGSFPSIIFVLIVELYFVRWLQRTLPATDEEAKLRTNQRKVSRRRMLQSGLALWIGGVLIAMPLQIKALMDISAWPMYGWGAFWFGPDAPWGHPLLYYILYSIGTVFLGLAILPTDTKIIRMTAFAYGWFHTYDFAWIRHTGRFGLWVPTTPPGFHLIWIILRSFITLAFFRAAVFRGRHALPGRQALRLMWVALRLAGLLTSADMLNSGLFWLPMPQWRNSMFLPPTVFSIFNAVLYASINPAVRRRLQRGLVGFGQSARDASAATVIGAMVGGDVISAMRSAEERLRYILISSLKSSDMANNQDSGLYAKVHAASLGEVDAFLSHSWRDDPPLKWQRMLEFKASFESKNGGAEPRCWLDKVSGHGCHGCHGCPVHSLHAQAQPVMLTPLACQSVASSIPAIPLPPSPRTHRVSIHPPHRRASTKTAISTRA